MGGCRHLEGGISEDELWTVHAKVDEFIEMLRLMDRYGDELEIVHKLVE